MVSIAASACQPSEGRFSWNVEWAIDVPDDPLSATVLVVAEARESVIKRIGPFDLESRAALQLDAVPNGEGLVLVLELSAPGREQVEYYGISDAFDLAPEHSVEVGTRVPVRRVPGVDPGVRVIAAGIDATTGTTAVSIELTTDTGVRAEVWSSVAPDLVTRFAWDVGGPAPAREVWWNAPACETESCPQLVLARFFDENGYASPLFFAPLVVDLSPPRVLEAYVRPDRVGPSARIALDLVFSETLSGAPRVEVPGRDLGFTVQPDAPIRTRTYAFRAMAPASALATAGPHEIRVSGVADLAGNEIAPLAVGTIFFDPSLPEVLSATVAPSIVARTGTVTVSFEVNKVLAVPPLLFLGDRLIGALAAGQTRHTHTFTLVADDPEGTVAVTAQLADDVGNLRKIRLGDLSIDGTAPTLVALEVRDPVLRPGGGTTLTILTDEPLGSPPALGVVAPSGSLSLGMTCVNASSSREVACALVAPLWPLRAVHQIQSVGLFDQAGNSILVGAGDPWLPLLIEVDGVPPEISSFAPSTDRLGRTTPFSVSLEVDEPMAHVEGTVGSFALLCAAEPGVPGAHRCELPRTGLEIPLDAEVTLPLVVRAVDPAGNESEQAAQVSFDFRAPAVASALLDIEAPLPSLVESPTEATADSRVTISVFADEIVDPSSLELSAMGSGGATLDFSLASVVGTEVVFEVVVPPSFADGTYLPELEWSDGVGNTETVDMSSLAIAVRTSPPALLIDEDEVVYVRSPQGNAAVEDLGSVSIPQGPYAEIAPAEPLADQATLPGSTFSLADGRGLSFLRVWGDPARTTLLAVLRPQGGEWPRTIMPTSAFPAVYLSGVDGAGAESEAVRVRTGELVLTTNGATPHRLVHRDSASGGPAEFPVDLVEDLEISGSTAAAGLDGTTHSAVAAARWTLTSSVPPPGPTMLAFQIQRCSTARTVATAGDRLLAFDGLATYARQRDAWVALAGRPIGPPLGGVVLVPSAAAPDFLMGGGIGFFGCSWILGITGTVRFDGSSFVQLAGGATGQDLYDAQGSGFIRVSSSFEIARLDAADTWQPVTVAGAAPLAGCALLRAHFDVSAQRPLLLADCPSGTMYAEAERMPNGSYTLHVAPSPGSAPPASGSYALDPARGVVVRVFGQETWEWRRAIGWLRVDPPIRFETPPLNMGATIVFDPASRRVLMFRACSHLNSAGAEANCFPLVNDVWVWGADPERAPSIEWNVATSDPQIPIGALRRFRLRAAVGGRASPFGLAGDGAVVSFWRPAAGRWIEVASNVDPVTQPGLTSWEAAGAVQANELLDAAGLAVVRFSPAGINGRDPLGQRAAVALDYAELRLRYVSP